MRSTRSSSYEITIDRGRFLGCWLVLVVAAGCDGPQLRPFGSPPGNVSIRPVAGNSSALTVKGSCDSLLEGLRDRQGTAMEAAVDANLEYALGMLTDRNAYCYDPTPRNSCGGFFGGMFGRCGTWPTMEGLAMDQAGGADIYSTTNNQVAGVDEADLIKNDARYIYMVAGSEFLILDAWPANTTRVISRTPLPGVPQRMFVEGGRAVVFSDVGDQRTCTYDPFHGMVKSGGALLLSVFDIGTPEAPVLEREISLSGELTGARRIGDVIHTVVAFADISHGGVFSWPAGLDRNLCNSDLSAEQVVGFFEQMRAANRGQLQAATLASFLPGAVDRDFDGGTLSSENESIFGDCGSFHEPESTYGRGLLSLLSFPIADDGQLGVTNVVGRHGEVYASPESLYVAVSEYENTSGNGQQTALHKFRLGQGGAAATYQGSGRVPGRIVDQFAMDELDGALRIATTSWGSGGMTNNLFVLQQDAASQTGLEVTGSVEGFAPREDIRSVRFDGERGFVVTFRRTDPLFTFDLSDPTQPEILGELEIPGFSTYMHFLDADHLLTIGFDTDDQGVGWFQGVLLQVFDVSDMYNPQLLHRTVVGARGSMSDATADHLAFNFYGDLLAIPMAVCDGGSGGGDYGDEQTFNGLMVFRVNAQSGFEYIGGVDHGVQPGYASCRNWWTDPNSHVKRSVFMEDFVYSLSSGQLKVNPLADLSQELVTVPVPMLNSDNGPSCFWW